MSGDLLGRLQVRLAATSDPTLREMLAARIRELESPEPLAQSPRELAQVQSLPPRWWMRRVRQGETIHAWRARNAVRQAQIDAAARNKDDDG